MLKECYIRTASLVPLIPRIQTTTKTARYMGESIYRAVFHKIVFMRYSCLPCQKNGF